MAAQPDPATPSRQVETTDEVLVHGTRLRDLKAAVVAAEDRFYMRYNDLNKVDDYDIDCRMDMHTGTRIPQRRCFAKLLLEAMGQQGEEVLYMLQQAPKPQDLPGFAPSEPHAAGMGGAGRMPNTNPEWVWQAHYEDYRDNMLYLMGMNPDLKRLAREAEDARKRYDNEFKRRLKGRLVVID